eukprot:10505268-Alexandrium_andersonii.AAC.1
MSECGLSDSGVWIWQIADGGLRIGRLRGADLQRCMRQHTICAHGGSAPATASAVGVGQNRGAGARARTQARPSLQRSRAPFESAPKREGSPLRGRAKSTSA